VRTDFIGNVCVENYKHGDGVNLSGCLTTPNTRILQIAPWSRVLLEKLKFYRMAKEFSTFYGIQSFIRVPTRGCEWALSRGI